MSSSPSQSIELFFSYSHRDLALRDELERHLAALKHQGVISGWHDRQIGAGSAWAGEIDAHLNSARLILLLISADFLSSNYCYGVEMKRALERQAAGEAVVIPVLLRAVSSTGMPFSHLQALPTGGVPITSWKNQDEAFADVARGIAKAADELRAPDYQAPVIGSSTVADRPALTHELRMLQERARGVIGRDYVEKALDRFIAKHRRGYFVIVGSPGQGKTSIAARLVARRSLVHHFISRTGRHRAQDILTSLILQLDANVESRSLATAPVDDLTVMLEKALRHRAQDAAPALVVLDGLNELPAEDASDPFFLPTDSMTDGAYVLVTSQPGERVMRLQEELATVPTEIYQLGPLRADEIHELIRLHVPDASAATIKRLAEASRGDALYLAASLQSLDTESDSVSDRLPDAVEGYYRRAMRQVANTEIAHNALGLLAVSRASLSLRDLSLITGAAERTIAEEAIRPLTPFLLEDAGRFSFYHEQFHEFVAREVLYGDERRGFHRKIADWLVGPEGQALEYYWTSLAYHLFHSGDTQRVGKLINDRFLEAKLRRFGYAVLEDLEFLAAALLGAGDPSVVELCVSRLDGLRQALGGEVLDELARSVQRSRLQSTVRHGGAIVRRIGEEAGIDACAILIPKRDVTADFVEAVPGNGGLVVAIGDAPMTGLKSAFVARFIGSLFRSLASSPGAPDVARILGEVSATIGRHPYFERVSMQCVEVRPDLGVITLASAGHPYPVLYSTRHGRCEQLPVRGSLLHAQLPGTSEARAYQLRHAEIDAGDVLVLLSDGIADGGPVNDPYGYRFSRVIERQARGGARRICEAIIDDWREHQQGGPARDDATLVVLKVTAARA